VGIPRRDYNLRGRREGLLLQGFGEQEILHLVSTVLVFLAAAVPAYMSLRLKGTFRRLTLLLSLFILIHGFYHASMVAGLPFLANDVLEPLSIAALIAFGLDYMRVTRKNREVVEN
jgi:hypothetical protein